MGKHDWQYSVFAGVACLFGWRLFSLQEVMARAHNGVTFLVTIVPVTQVGPCTKYPLGCGTLCTVINMDQHTNQHIVVPVLSRRPIVALIREEASRVGQDYVSQWRDSQLMLIRGVFRLTSSQWLEEELSQGIKSLLCA